MLKLKSSLIAVSVAIVVVLGYLAWQRGSEVLDNANGPLEYATIMHKTAPNTTVPLEMLKRLDNVSASPWDMRLFQDARDVYGGEPLAPRLDKIARFAEVPDIKQWGLVAVMTNAFNADWVRDNGTLYMLWFGFPPTARDFLMTDPKVFVDPKVEARRDTYQTGAVVSYYSPSGVDRTESLRQFLKEIVVCPKSSKPCTLNADIEGFDKYAERAGA